MEFILSKISVIMRFAQGLSGGYAALMLCQMGFYYMTKNRQKLEEAQDGIKNIIIGLLICGGAEMIIQFFK